MITEESKVYAAVAKALRAAHPTVFTSGEFVKAPPKFPAVTIIEESNRVHQRMQTLTQIEVAANVMIELNFYSNKTVGKKAECQAMAKVADREMQELGYRRVLLQPIPNYEDATIYRMVGRYERILIGG